jgi:hypothetical protein
MMVPARLAQELLLPRAAGQVVSLPEPYQELLVIRVFGSAQVQMETYPSCKGREPANVIAPEEDKD